MEASHPSPTISVVIPLFNKQEAIERAILSVFRQTRPPEELIIVDDGSSDGSREIAAATIALAGDKMDCRLIAQPNSGVSVARNRGAEESSGGYIAFLDADDEWLPDYLGELEKLAVQFPSAGVLTVRYGKINSDGELIPEPCSLPNEHFGTVNRTLEVYRKGYGLIHTSSVAVRRDAWERSGGFPAGARKSQDMFLWLKLCMTERFAHSGRAQSIWHDDHTGVARRMGAVPYHFAYFLGTEEGRRYLDNRDLIGFLGSNLLIHVGGHRLSGDDKVVRELRRLSSALPMKHRLSCLIASISPLWFLREIAKWRQRSRGLRR